MYFFNSSKKSSMPPNVKTQEPRGEDENCYFPFGFISTSQVLWVKQCLHCHCPALFRNSSPRGSLPALRTVGICRWPSCSHVQKMSTYSSLCSEAASNNCLLLALRTHPGHVSATNLPLPLPTPSCSGHGDNEAVRTGLSSNPTLLHEPKASEGQDWPPLCLQAPLLWIKCTQGAAMIY